MYSILPISSHRLFRRRRLRPQPIRMELGDLRRMMPPPPEIQWDSGSDDGWNEDDEADDGGEGQELDNAVEGAEEGGDADEGGDKEDIEEEVEGGDAKGA